MTGHVVLKDWPDSIAFDRLHSLAARGYKAKLGTAPDDSGFTSIELSHPKLKSRKPLPPEVTLWSNGILSTRQVLWPDQYVAQDGGPPVWQKFIDAGDSDRFASFLQSVPLPNWLDKYMRPIMANAKVFAGRLTFGASLCVALGLISKVVQSTVSHSFWTS